MTQDEIRKVFEKCGAILTNTHVVYTSGRHGSAYVNKDALYPHTEILSRLAAAMAVPFEKSGVEVVLAPALGGIVLSTWVANALTLSTKKEVLSVFAEKENGAFVLRRGYDKLVKGKKTLILEDVLTTGGSVQKVVELAKSHGAQVLGVSALVNRGKITAEMLKVNRLESLLAIDLDSWEASECPLCKKNVKINTEL